MPEAYPWTTAFRYSTHTLHPNWNNRYLSKLEDLSEREEHQPDGQVRQLHPPALLKPQLQANLEH